MVKFHPFVLSQDIEPKQILIEIKARNCYKFEKNDR